LLERVRAVPGIEAAAITVARPLGGGLAPGTSYWPTDRPAPEASERPVADIRMVSPDFFRTMGIPLVRGRDFDWRDDADAPPVIIINETAARTHWPAEDPIGKQMVVRMGDETPRTIVGVAGDVRHSDLRSAPRATVYYPHAQLNFPWFDLMVRSSADPAALLPALRREVLAVDPNLPLYSAKRMTEVVSESVAEQRFNMLLLSLFATIALTLAAVGIYGVMSFSVNQRTHEIGIRVALGAERGRVLRLVVGQGLALAVAGVAIGLAAAFALTRLMRSLLFEVSSTDALTFVAVPLLLIATAYLACYLPARRAARVDPMVAMRYE
jgi:putative ABC transport system permease protein